MGCIEAQRSERHYRQVRLLNHVKLTTSRPTSYEKEYKQLLTPFAFDCVASELKHMSRTTGDHLSSIDSCDCIFFRCMSLPCRHMFRERAEAGMYLFCDLVAKRWTSSYNNPINFTYSVILWPNDGLHLITTPLISDQYRKQSCLCPNQHLLEGRKY